MNKAVEINQDSENIYFTRALVLKELGDVQGAVSDYEKAIKIDSSYADALYNRVSPYNYMG